MEGGSEGDGGCEVRGYSTRDEVGALGGRCDLHTEHVQGRWTVD